MAESIVILDDDEEESLQPSSSSAISLHQHPTSHILPLKAQPPTPTHITQSPFATAKKDSHVLLAENQRLFTEFVEYCSSVTQDVPEVMTFLHCKHTKACPEYLSSVEFRNTLGRCLTRAQANRSKTYVYINELCTALRQHSAKRRQTLAKSEPRSSASASLFTATVKLKSNDERKQTVAEEGNDGGKRKDMTVVGDEQPSTSGLQEERGEKSKVKEEEEEEKKTKRASKKQIAYLENLLKEYNDEIRRLQSKELNWDDMESEDSVYIQEHRLKRKMMKIYDKLCELKGCNTLTGRVIEQRIFYNSTRYPEINRKIERFINRPEVQLNPPDYTDFLQQVQRANERHNLCLSRKQVIQIAQDAFRETGNRLQERRHLDMVYNFGCHLTDVYKPATDPALKDSSLLRTLRNNREVAVTKLEEVISKYAIKQDDTEEQERNKRLEKGRMRNESPPNSTKELTKKEGSKRKMNMSGYSLFSSEMREVIKKQHPDLSFRELSRLVSTEWKNLEDPKKAEYEERAAKVAEQQERDRASQQQASPRSGVNGVGGGPKTTGTYGSQKSEEKEQNGDKEEDDEEEEEEEEEEEREEDDEEEEEEEDDVSSDPDIEEEIQASTQQAGPDDDDEEDDTNEAEQAGESTNEEGGHGDGEEDREGVKEEEENELVTCGLNPTSNGKISAMSPLSESPSPEDRPSQSEAIEPKNGKQSSSNDLTLKKEPLVSTNHLSSKDTCEVSQKTTDLHPAGANRVSPSPSLGMIRASEDSCTEICELLSVVNGSPGATRSRKRKREESESKKAHINYTVINGSEIEIPLDMGVVSSPPPHMESTRAESPTQNLVTSSQTTPPPKKNKVNVATQCDPDEIIVLSDSE